MDPHGALVGSVAQIWRFPVKSMRGERLDEVAVSSAGVVGDRGWAMIDTSDGRSSAPRTPASGPGSSSCDPDTLRTVAAANRLEIEGLGTWACADAYGDAASPGTVRVGDPVSLQD